MKANHLDVVQDEHARQPPTSGDLLSVFRFEQRVLARLAREFPGEQWGYLKKGGDNTIQYGAGEIKVGRVCGPDSQLYKIATDIPTVNAPVWNDDGILTNDFPGSKPEAWWLPYDGAGASDGPPVPTPVPTPVPPPVPTPPPVVSPQDLADLVAVMKTFNALLARIADAETTHEAMQVLRHADVVAHFDELKRILAAQTFEGEVQIRYLGTAKITLRPVK